MSRRGLALLAAVVVAALALGCGNGSSANGVPERIAPKPRLLVGQLYPLTVNGVAFRPGEQVTVVLDGGKRGRKAARATAQGRFTLRFAVRLSRCGTLTVRATGSYGSRAVHQVPRPDCREP
jgi:hypothetical protein